VNLNSILSSLTLEQKIAQISSVCLSQLLEDGVFCPAKAEGLLANGIGWIVTLQENPEISLSGARAQLAKAQAYLRTRTPVPLPAIMTDEAICGQIAHGSVIFPQAHNQAQTWNPALIEDWARHLGPHLRAHDITQVLSPVLDIAREPRWGRCEETFGEDPLLSAAMGVAYVRGLAGDDLAKGVASMGKHFAGYSACEGGHNFGSCHVTPRDLRDNHLFSFEAAIREGGLTTLMVAYHDIDGVPCAFNYELLTTILRDQWGFEGLTVTDFFGLGQQTAFFFNSCADGREVTRRAKLAGLDVEMPTPDHFRTHLPGLIAAGLVPEALIDASVKRVLALKEKLGLLAADQPQPAPASIAHRTPQQEAQALEIAEQSLVLLKNDGGLLPLAPAAFQHIAVIGPCADRARTLLADYAFPQARQRNCNFYGHESAEQAIVTVLQGITHAVKDHAVQINYAPGCELMSGTDESRAQAVATAAAAAADVVVMVLGEESMVLSGEGFDRCRLELPAAQEKLLQAVAATGKPIVLVLTYGRPLALAGVAPWCRAIVAAGYPGEQGGHAIARLIFGEISPSGRLAMSFPHTTGHTPAHYARQPNSLNSYADFPQQNSWALYPFGHGLTYTQFTYSDLVLDADQLAPDATLEISFRVKNTGARAAVAVPQLYIQGYHKSVLRPLKELKAFTRVELAPGESRHVEFSLPLELLAFHGADLQLKVESGPYELMVGSSSALIHLRQVIHVTGERAIARRSCFFAQTKVLN